jgi:hypothetical protein
VQVELCQNPKTLSMPGIIQHGYSFEVEVSNAANKRDGGLRLKNLSCGFVGE